jgi:hypothetical protein
MKAVSGGLVLLAILCFAPGIFAQCIYISGDVNNNGDATSLADVIYGANYFAGGPPPPLSCVCGSSNVYVAAEVNGSCAYNGLDVVYLINYWSTSSGHELQYCSSCPLPQADIIAPPSGVDVGMPDSIIIGNLNGAPIYVIPGDTVSIPIWIKCDEPVYAVNIPLAADTIHIKQWLSGVKLSYLSAWSYCAYRQAEPDRPGPGYSSQTLLGWKAAHADGPALYTYGEFQQVASFALATNPDTAILGETIQIIPGSHSRAGVAAFCDTAGLAEWSPTVVSGSVIFALEPTHIGLSPAAFVDTVNWGYSTSTDLYIANMGTPDLFYTIRDSVNWISAIPYSGRLHSSDADTVTLTFDAATLSPGTYFSQIIISSNDSEYAAIIIPVTLVVEVGLPFGRIDGTVISAWAHAIPNVVVSLSPTGLTDTTDQLGQYAFGPIPAQTYDILFSNPSYFDTLVSNLVLPNHDTVILDITMRGLPGVIHVPGQNPTIQIAINGSWDGDTILVGPGVYSENINYLGRSVIIKSSGGPARTIIEPTLDSLPIVNMISHENAGLIGFTLRSAFGAPAIMMDSSSAAITGNIFSDNQNNDLGGAILANYAPSLNIVDNTFINNIATGDHYNGSGGAIAAYQSRTVISGNIFENNRAYAHGGALILYESDSSEVHHNLFYNNRSYGLGGAIVVYFADSTKIYHNTIVSNISDQPALGGGIAVYFSHNTELHNNIITGNTGCGLYSDWSYENSALYNDVYGNNPDYFNMTAGEGSISEDPLFVSPPSSFSLRHNSPCVDAGDPSTAPDPDLSLPDMGAYYYGSADYGYLTGLVSNYLGQPIPNVYVTIPGTAFGDSSDENGYFYIGRFRCNQTYDLFFSHFDYIETTLTNVAIPINDSTHLNITLRAEGARCSIGGVVSDSVASPIQNVVVHIISTGYSDTTDILGRYLLENVRPGIYDISFIHPVFADTVIRNFEAAAGVAETLNVSLRSAYSNYRIFYGRLDREPIPVVIGTTTDIPVWGSTPVGNYTDTINFMHVPLASNDTVISARLGGTFPDTLVGRWDDIEFEYPNLNTPLTGWTNQSMMAFGFIYPPPNPENWFWTNGEIAPICTFRMMVADNSSLLGDTLSPFRTGSDPTDGGLIWILQDGARVIVPIVSFPKLYFLSPSQVGFIAGSVKDSLTNPLVGVIVETSDHLKRDTTDSNGNYQIGWFMPGVFNLNFYKQNIIDSTISNISVSAGDTTLINIFLGGEPRGCFYRVGDINGSGTLSGLDVVYGVRYFKGGPPPATTCPMCPQTPPFYAAGDVNGSCTFSGLDITFLVRYFKGGAVPYPCPSCPPLGR